MHYYDYGTCFSATEMWSASSTGTTTIQEDAFADENLALQSKPASVKTLVAIGLIASLISIGFGTLAFSKMNGTRQVALLETSVATQVAK
ncbi:hypothetical protein K9N68_14480 [Kovacikia minuta CCNUW1]|uniref:hypothetical protein n=1 Tax=Kovacikia minuta TaxID=2931930 RepID=UPI001CCAE5DD|nr:hypothetical protein [Kovacikia minuta]UBF28937.1 hypothetical protein K9N68_14480 [Kovacikia minuta CCNUW1]